MASLDPIEIIIAAKDQASAVLAGVSAQVKAMSAEMNALADDTAAKQGAIANTLNDVAMAGSGGVMARDAQSATESHGALANAVGDTAGASGALAATERDLATASDEAAVSLEKKAVAAETATGATKDLKTAAFDAKPAIQELGSQAGISSQFLGMGGMGLGTAAALTGAILGGVAVKSAGDFQAQLTRLATSAGENVQNLGMVGNGIKQVAIDTGTSTTQLSAAMYIIESGGQHAGAGLEVLKAAAQGAKAEGSDLATVADAVTSAMTDYGYTADKAATVTSKLVAATGAGKTTFQQLAAAMPAILPTASAAHISLNEILGDLASMTMHGMSADQAAQNLAHSIRSLQSPTQAMSKEMAALGLNSTEVSQQLGQKGLYGTIQEIAGAIKQDMGPDATAVILNMEDALKGLPASVQAVSQEIINGTANWTDWNKATKDLTVTQRSQAQAFATLYNGMHTIGTEQMSGAQVMQTYAGAMNKAVGTADGLNVALMLTGQNSQNTNNAIAAVSKATAEAGNNVKGWSDIQNNFNTRISQFWQLLNVGMISVGEKLLPFLTQVVGGFVDFSKQVMDGNSKVGELFKSIGAFLGPSFEALGKVIETQVVPTLTQLWTQVVVPLGVVLGGAFLVALKLTVQAFTALLQIVTPVVNFLVTNKEFLTPIISAFIALKTAMMIQAAFTAVQAGFATLTAVTIPGAVASFTSLSALIATPIVMPAIVVAAAIASLALVQNAANQATAAINQEMNTNNQERDTSVALIKSARQQYNSGQISAAKLQQLIQIYSAPIPGHALGTNFAPGGLTMVGENGPELVNMPTGSKVYNAQQTQQMLADGGRVIVNMGGVTIASNMDQQKFLADLGWRLANA